MEDFLSYYGRELLLVIGVYVIAFFSYYRSEDKLRSETKNKLTGSLSIIEHQVLTRLINKSWYVKGEVKNSEGIRYIVMEKMGNILFLRCKHYIGVQGICLFIGEDDVEMFSRDLKEYMNDNKCYARGLYITTCYTTKNRREQANMNNIDLWDAFRRKWNLWKI